MTMEMAPDGRIYFNEIGGKLRLLDPKTGSIQTVGEIEVWANQENGFLGFALDPEFEKNGHVFVQYSPTDYEGQSISRFTVKDDKMDPASRVELLRWPVQREHCCHHAGEISFGPDGNLYFSTGDNTSPHQSDGFTPIDERVDRTPFDAQKSAANTNDLRGKINRIRPMPDGSYTIPEGNFFPVGTEKTRSEIFAMGFRNPWRFTVDAKSGIVYVGDVGPDSAVTTEERGPNGFDTVNQIRKPAYFGWPYSRGKEVYRDYDFDGEAPGEFFNKGNPVNNSPNNTGLTELPPTTPPMIWYARGKSEEFPLLGIGGRTACAGEVFHYKPEFAETDGFPEHFDGALLWFDWQRPLLMWAMMDEDSNFTSLEKFSDSAQIAQGEADESKRMQFKRPIDLFFGPDGCAYIMDYGETWGKNADAKIVKVVYQRGNLNPIANIAMGQKSGGVPFKTKLSAKGSTDPEGKALGYEWVLLPEEKVISATEEAEVAIEESGNYEIELRVTDPEGAVGTTRESLVVGNTAPVVAFLEPKDGDFFDHGDTLEYKIRIDDEEDGNSVDGNKAESLKFATLLTTEWLDGKKHAADSAVGMTLMKQSGCFNCHAMDTQIVGPPLVEIAEKYRGQKGAMDASADRVLKGSSGVWGQVPMLPHPQHSKDEIFMMVEWIYSLKKGEGGSALRRGTEGVVNVPKNKKIRHGVLRAEFKDFGNSPAAPLETTTVVNVRTRLIEAENADAIKGPRVMRNRSASGRAALGHITHNGSVKFANINLGKVSSISVGYATASGPRKIEFRTGAQDGPKIGEIILESTGDWKEETKATDAVVEVDDVTSDEAIERRLNGIFEQVREFEDVRCVVTSGVVRLSGTVPDEATRGNALALAERTDGVIFTVDRMKAAAEVQAQLTPALKKLRALRTSFVTKLPLIGIALLVVVFSILLANFLHRRDHWLKKLKISSLTRVLIRRIVRITVIGFGVIAALEVLDATAVVGALLGAAGLAGLAIGFAFRNIAENYLAGILLSTRNPFELGDAIELNGMIGKVAALSARDTVLITLDGNHLRIPNSVVMNSELLNYSRNPLRRLEFTVGVSVDLELNEARQVGLAAMKSSPGILQDPKPSVSVDSLGDSTVILRFFGWLDQRESDFLKTKSETIRLVKMAYDAAGIEMPEPIYRVYLKGGLPSPEVPAATPEKPRRKPDTEEFDVELSDTSPDRTIDDQIEAEKEERKDENLLEDTGGTGIPGKSRA
eukprot:g4165.t1